MLVIFKHKRTLLALVFCIATLTISACSKKSPKPKSSPAQAIIPIAPPKSPGQQETASSVCDEFHTLLNSNLSYHILRLKKDKPLLLSYAMAYFKNYPNDTYIQQEHFTQLSEKNALESFVGLSKKEQCDLIEETGKNTSIELEGLETQPDTVSRAYLKVFEYFLFFSDNGYSRVIYNLENDSPESIVKRIGIIVARRPDYRGPLKASDGTWVNRNANYLYIHNVHPESTKLRRDRKNIIHHYLTHICKTQDDCDPISNVSFDDDFFETYSQDNEESLTVKLLNPKDNTEKFYSIPIEPLNSVKAYAYAHKGKSEDSLPPFILKIRSFYTQDDDLYKNTIKQGVQDYIEDYGEYPKHWVIDLRNNGGGYLGQAIFLAENFLPPQSLLGYRLTAIQENDKKVILEEDENASFVKSEEKYFYQEAFGTYEDNRSPQFKEQKPKIILLVNEGSASASEIFTAAFKDHKMGLIMGTKTFGKTIGQDRDKQKFNGISFHVLLTQTYYFSPLGYSHLLYPNFINKEHKNPFDNLEYTSMMENLSGVDFKDDSSLLTESPNDLDWLNTPLSTEAQIEQNLMDSMQVETLPASCTIPEDFSLIKEEDDCLLDIAGEYFSQWSELQ